MLFSSDIFFFVLGWRFITSRRLRSAKLLLLNWLSKGMDVTIVCVLITYNIISFIINSVHGCMES